MAGEVTYFYGGIPVFSGIAPSPFLNWDQENLRYEGNRWGAQTPLQLIGQITGKCDDFNDLIFKQNALLAGFAKNFQSLRIEEDGQTIFDQPYAIINSINFDTSNYVGLVPFTVNLDIYDNRYFSGYYGVINPEETTEFDETEDGILNITHRIAARGFNTDKSAFDNAKNWVLSRTGFKNEVVPFFIQACYGIQPCLDQFAENINRLAGEYAVTENYIVDLRRSGYGITRYSIDVNSGFNDGLNQVTINGDIRACKNISISGLRQIYSSLDLYSLALQNYNQATNLLDLSPFYLNSGVTEDSYAKTINFSCAFNNDNSPLVWVDYNVDLSKNSEDGYINVSISADILSRGPLLSRYEKVLNYFETQFNGFILANDQYMSSDFYSGIPLNPIPSTESVQKSPNQGTINYSASWSTKASNFSGIANIDYTIDVTPSIQQYAPVPSLFCNGTYYIFDLGMTNRKKVGINGNLTVAKGTPVNSGISIAQNLTNSIRGRYANGNRLILDQNSLTTGSPGNSKVSWNVQWSAEGNKITI